MAETLELEVATPERELVREQVSEVQLPGKEGYMGVLPGHAPLLGMLGVGILSYVAGGVKRHLSIHGGFLEILDDHVRVLADQAERAEEIDIQRAKAALQRSQEQAINPALGVEPAEALAAVMRAQARIAAAELK
jgi:F-type H+-transporting ATPase subunit epsilon